MKILVACEFSGVVRDAFIKCGHDAMSCDLLPTEALGSHYQGDVRDILHGGWDLLIAHPDCTYLTNSAEWAYKDGPYHQNVKPGTLVGATRQQARIEALKFVQVLFDAPIKKKCIENPAGVIGTRIRKASQFIHPFQFGHDASKKTGLWLENLPLLVPTLKIEPRIIYSITGKRCERWGNQTDSGQNNVPCCTDRWKERAKTFQGIADAMVQQWGALL